MTRYFYICYHAIERDGDRHTWYYHSAQESYPSMNEIFAAARRHDSDIKVAIPINLMELSEEDYNSLINKK
jgi:hypothetical protein